MKKLTLDCIAEFERRNCQDRDAYVTASAPVTAMGANAAGSPKQLRELFHLAVELERAALADDYFVSRKLFPNVGRGAKSNVCSMAWRGGRVHRARRSTTTRASL